MNINRVTKYKTSVALSVLLALGACDSTDGDFEDINITISQTDAVEQQSVAVTLDASQEIPTPVGVPANASGIADVAVDENGVVTATLTVSNRYQQMLQHLQQNKLKLLITVVFISMFTLKLMHQVRFAGKLMRLQLLLKRQ